MSLKITHTCGYEKELEFLCPQCGLPFCEEDSQQVQGGQLAGHVINDDKIIDLQDDMIVAYDDISVLQNDYKSVSVINANYSALNTDCVLLVNTGSDSNKTISLPTSVDNVGKIFTIFKLSGSKNVIVDPYGSETINGSATQTIGFQYGSLTIVSNGADWLIIAKMT